MKKILAVLVAVATLVSTMTALNVYAWNEVNTIELPVGVYPESEHDYQNNICNVWVYTHPTEADGLFITFSEKTELGEYNYEYDENGNESGFTWDCISLSSCDNNNDWYEFWENDYRLKELAGKTVYLPGNQFRIQLYTDEEGTSYGFSIDSISVEPPEDERMLCYHLDGAEKTDFYECLGDNEMFVRNMNATRKPGVGFMGWSTEPDGKAEYFFYDIIDSDELRVDLYAVWSEPLLIAAEDAFSFCNSDIGRTPPANFDYYMTDEHYDMMIANLFKTFGLGPIPGPIAAAVLSKYPSWEFTGSCYGMAASVFLNYHGIDEFLKVKGAENLSEIELDGDVISMVNYYQAQAASSYLCENIAPNPGTAYYSENLRNVYETLKNGKPVLLTYYKGEYLKDMGHSVTLTGAFEDSYGNIYFVGYDSNFDYVNGECHYFRITPDFKQFYNCYNAPKNITEEIYLQNGLLTGFNWTSDYEQFTSFDINGEGNPLVWYKVFFGHIVYWMSTVFSATFGF